MTSYMIIYYKYYICFTFTGTTTINILIAIVKLHTYTPAVAIPGCGIIFISIKVIYMFIKVRAILPQHSKNYIATIVTHTAHAEYIKHAHANSAQVFSECVNMRVVLYFFTLMILLVTSHSREIAHLFVTEAYTLFEVGAVCLIAWLSPQCAMLPICTQRYALHIAWRCPSLGYSHVLDICLS